MLSINDFSTKIDKFSLGKINLNIEDNKYFVLLGASGSGKTVFLESIVGRYPNSKGKIVLNHKDITSFLPENRNIGFVYQNYELFPHMKVCENIAFPLKLRKVSKKECEYKVDEVLEIMQIKNIKNRYPQDLSGGEKQRVAISRSLMVFPDLLLLDEPMSALDYRIKQKIKSILKDAYMRYKPTVIHVTHDISEALYFAQTIGIMKNGKISNIFEVNDDIKKKGEEFFYEYI